MEFIRRLSAGRVVTALATLTATAFVIGAPKKW
jgi:hypothetical protein